MQFVLVWPPDSSLKSLYLVILFSRKKKEKTILMDVNSEEDHVLGYQKALFTLNMLLRNINDSIKEGKPFWKSVSINFL